ncbi:MAG: signal peptide peptidase SppA [Chloroflexaceae bacterium]|nr:signal peptide peptidase SppA [Chloroflexaceae bacterium]
MQEQQQSTANQPQPAQPKGRGLLIGLSIILGIVLACAILPIGAFAVLVASVDSEDTSLPRPATTWREKVVSGQGPDRVVIIEVTGVIGAPEDTSILSSQISQQDILSQIRQATEDPKVKALVLRVDSPGGGVVASNEIHRQLKEFTATEKPLVVSMGTVAASGGYYIATPADQIYANADTFTGSLGVILSLLNYEDTLDMLGMQQLVFKSGEFKDIGSPAREITPEEEAILQGLIDQAYNGFVDVITEGRNMDREEVLRLADGRIYTGQQAMELGLIDELGNLDDSIAASKELAGLSEALIVRYTSSTSLTEALLGALTQQQQPADPLGLRHATELTWPRLEYRMVP